MGVRICEYAASQAVETLTGDPATDVQCERKFMILEHSGHMLTCYKVVNRKVPRGRAWGFRIAIISPKQG